MKRESSRTVHETRMECIGEYVHGSLRPYVSELSLRREVPLLCSCSERRQAPPFARRADIPIVQPTFPCAS